VRIISFPSLLYPYIISLNFSYKLLITLLLISLISFKLKIRTLIYLIRLNSMRLKIPPIINLFISCFCKASNNTPGIIILPSFRNFNKNFILAFFLFIIKIIKILFPLVIIINILSKSLLSLFSAKLY